MQEAIIGNPSVVQPSRGVDNNVRVESRTIAATKMAKEIYTEKMKFTPLWGSKKVHLPWGKEIQVSTALPVIHRLWLQATKPFEIASTAGKVAELMKNRSTPLTVPMAMEALGLAKQNFEDDHQQKIIGHEDIAVASSDATQQVVVEENVDVPPVADLMADATTYHQLFVENRPLPGENALTMDQWYNEMQSMTMAQLLQQEQTHSATDTNRAQHEATQARMSARDEVLQRYYFQRLPSGNVPAPDIMSPVQQQVEFHFLRAIITQLTSMLDNITEVNERTQYEHNLSILTNRSSLLEPHVTQ